MKNIILFILFFAIGFSQATSLALYGIGEKIRDTNPASLALGNSIFFSGNSKNISSGSPSSMWRSSLTRFSIHTGMNYLNASSFPQQFQHNLTHFSLTFPVGNKKVFGFGLQQAFRTNRLTIEGDYQYGTNDNGADIVYKNNYFVDGGISKLFVLYSLKTSTNISFGIQHSFLFGNQFIDDKLDMYEIVIDTIASGSVISEIVDDEKTYFIHPISGEIINVKINHQYAGAEIIFEGKYSTAKHEWVARLGVNSAVKVKTEDNISGNYISNSDAIISEIALGYHYKKSDHAGIILESHVIPPYNLPDAVALFDLMPPHENSIHLGTYFQVENPKFGLWNNLNFRGGGYLKQLDFDGEQYIDYGFTFGLGLEYIANTQTFDIAIRTGKKESYIIKGQNEDYISIHFGITTGEKWFVKRRRK